MANLFDIANFNLISFAQNITDLQSSTPATIPVQYKDADGNLQTAYIDNRGMFQKKVWDDVGGALGQFSRVFYVDQVNGDDNNTGASDSPFKTIKKAITSVPYGGKGKICLKNNQIHILADGDNYESIQILQKTIIFSPSEPVTDSNPKPVIKFDSCLLDDYPDNTSILKRLEVGIGGILSMESIDLKYPDPIDDDHPFSSWNIQSQPLLVNGGIEFTYIYGNCDIANANNLSLICISRYYNNPSISIYDSTINLSTDSYVINNRSGCPFTLYAGECSVTENGGSDNLYLTKTIKTIIKDADSGNPINVISNINFSD